ncbi:MAG: prefoldin subunit beta [Nanoarchaeota archaeon]|nr:prefoldin subunit beta [Nanoarchaeota archaeon]MBU0962727.1 prefoldin subunit beta [Nanoarchaeota archaeon]
MKLSKETEAKIIELQTFEQNLNNFAMQKQRFQITQTEIENAIEELKKTKEDAYKIIGSIMIKSKKEDLEKDLNEKKEIIDLRIKNIEKQENKIKEKASELQKEVMSKIENEK